MAQRTTAMTPWGSSQQESEVAPGVVFHSTASHGGYYVAPVVKRTWPSHLQEFPTFAGGNWYEEDCDAAIVMMAMPNLFGDEALASAIGMARSPYSGHAKSPAVQGFLKSPSGMALIERVDSWVSRMKSEGRYQQSGGVTSGKGWSQCWMPYGEGPMIFTFHANYPMDMPSLPTKAELESKYGTVRVQEAAQA